MKKNKDSFQEDLKKIINPYLKEKKMSHIYCECGFLNEDNPLFSFAHLPHSQTIFDLASLTKALATAPLIHRFLENKNLNFDVTVEQAFSNEVASILKRQYLNLKLDDLLSHKSGLPAWRNFWINCFDDDGQLEIKDVISHKIEVLNRITWNKREKTDFCYSDVGYILLSLLLELYYKEDISKIFETFKQENNISQNTVFYPTKITKDNKSYIPTSYCFLRKRILRGEVHDENAACLKGLSGHAGLFSTGSGLARFLKEYARCRAGESFFLMNSRLVKKDGDPLLGLRQGSDLHGKGFACGLNMGHLGFTGTAFFIDPKDGRYAIVLTNRVMSGRLASWMARFRFQIFSFLESCFER